MSIETEIQTEVEALRSRFSDTKDLYREVCALLFFRHGITPTANKLYQFVRKGSMSAPADALVKFWDELRSKARIEIDHPDLPADLRDIAATAIAGIWQQATSVARGELASLRLDAQAQVEAARAELALSERRAAELEEQLVATRAQVAGAAETTNQLRNEFEAERRAHAGALARLEELQHRLAEHQRQREAARIAFSADLAKAREAVDVANARADASERRALLEVDQERQARARADKQFEALRTQLVQAEGRLRDEALMAADIQARLQAKAEALEQANHELRAAAARCAIDLESVQKQFAIAQSDLLRHKTEAETLRTVLLQLSPKSDTPEGPSELARRLGLGRCRLGCKATWPSSAARSAGAVSGDHVRSSLRNGPQTKYSWGPALQ
jgi:hypothetical protein